MATQSIKGTGKKSAAAKPKTARPKAPARAFSPAARPPADKAEDASAFLAALDHPLKADIEAVRKIVLGASPEIAEGVKRLPGTEIHILKNKEAKALFNSLKKAGRRVAIHYHSTC